MQIIEIKEQDNVFCDALVSNTNNYNLIFASVWGRNTSLQQLLGRMETTVYQDKISQMSIQADIVYSAYLQDTKYLAKVSTKVHKTIYGKDLSHMFIYDKSITNIDYANNQATILFKQNNVDNDKVWLLLNSVSPIPLLTNSANWQKSILGLCNDNNWISVSNGYSINALQIKLNPDDFAKEVSVLIKQGVLTLEQGGNHGVNVSKAS